MKEKLLHLCTKGSPVQAKFAVRAINAVCADDAESLFNELLTVCSLRLSSLAALEHGYPLQDTAALKPSAAQLPTMLRCASQIAKLRHAVFAAHFSSLEPLIDSVLTVNAKAKAPVADSDRLSQARVCCASRTRLAPTLISLCRRQCMALKLLVHNALGLRLEDDDAKMIVSALYKRLVSTASILSLPSRAAARSSRARGAGPDSRRQAHERSQHRGPAPAGCPGVALHAEARQHARASARELSAEGAAGLTRGCARQMHAVLLQPADLSTLSLCAHHDADIVRHSVR
jgi:hypothetical protein